MTPVHAAALLLLAGPAQASPASAERALGSDVIRVAEITLPCLRELGCLAPIDRDVRPFEGTLGRPCGYRWRATPSGTRKVRICH